MNTQDTQTARFLIQFDYIDNQNGCKLIIRNDGHFLNGNIKLLELIEKDKFLSFFKERLPRYIEYYSQHFIKYLPHRVEIDEAGFRRKVSIELNSLITQRNRLIEQVNEISKNLTINNGSVVF